jgi:hypothetical protein
MPAIENITKSIISANHGLRLLSPLKSSMFSASKPARDSTISMPNEPPALIIT